MTIESTLPSEDGDKRSLARDRATLETARQALANEGFYAYGTVDDQNRWTIAVDDEAGRIDVRVGEDGLEISFWASSPGLYADEENEWRRRARERLARITLSNIARGFLEPHQHATWDEVDHGIAVTTTYELPFTRAEDLGRFARDRLPELDHLLALIERQLA